MPRLPCRSAASPQRLRGTQDVELEWEDMVDEIEGEEAQRRRAMQAPHLSSHNRFQRSQLAGTIKWAWGYCAHLTICFMLGAFRTLTGGWDVCVCVVFGEVL